MFFSISLSSLERSVYRCSDNGTSRVDSHYYYLSKRVSRTTRRSRWVDPSCGKSQRKQNKIEIDKVAGANIVGDPFSQLPLYLIPDWLVSLINILCKHHDLRLRRGITSLPTLLLFGKPINRRPDNGLISLLSLMTNDTCVLITASECLFMNLSPYGIINSATRAMRFLFRSTFIGFLDNVYQIITRLDSCNERFSQRQISSERIRTILSSP